jgi:hypothetical protein
VRVLLRSVPDGHVMLRTIKQINPDWTLIDGRFNVKIVGPGEMYGQNNAVQNGGEAIIEFYDSKHLVSAKRPLGQFVSHYFLSTLMAHSGGLVLHGGVPGWHITEDGMDQVKALIKKYGMDLIRKNQEP